MSGSSSSTSPFAGRRVLLAPESAPSSHSGSWDAGRIGASSIRGLCLLRPCDLGGTSWDAAGRRGISSIRGLCRLRPCELGRAVSKSLSGSSIGEVDDGLTSSCAACPPQTQQTLSTPQRRSLRRAVRLVDDRTFRKNGCFYTDNSYQQEELLFMLGAGTCVLVPSWALVSGPRSFFYASWLPCASCFLRKFVVRTTPQIEVIGLRSIRS